MRTRIKVCGLTEQVHINAAVQAGVDAIGLVFYAPSPRAISVEQAAILRTSIPAFVSVVALFVNAEPDLVEQVIEQVQPSCLQFHGDEPESTCKQYNLPYMRAFRVGAPGLTTPTELAQYCQQYNSAAAWLFDSHSDQYGGSGRAFDWSLIKNVNARPLVLSGGLHAANVQQAIASVQPYAVDVSSGVEIEKGVKSVQKIHDFITQVRLSDCKNLGIS